MEQDPGAPKLGRALKGRRAKKGRDKGKIARASSYMRRASGAINTPARNFSSRGLHLDLATLPGVHFDCLEQGAFGTISRC